MAARPEYREPSSQGPEASAARGLLALWRFCKVLALRRYCKEGARRTLLTMLPDSMDELTEMKPAELINTLMGKKAELRFRFIQENAAFVEDLDI